MLPALSSPGVEKASGIPTKHEIYCLDESLTATFALSDELLEPVGQFGLQALTFQPVLLKLVPEVGDLIHEGTGESGPSTARQYRKQCAPSCRQFHRL